MADGILARIPESPAGLTDAQRRAAYADLDAGAAALEEVLKFVPAGADAVSPFAFWTERGRRFSLDSRWRFNAEGLRDSLAQVRAAQRSSVLPPRRRPRRQPRTTHFWTRPTPRSFPGNTRPHQRTCSPWGQTKYAGKGQRILP
jgi:hypothetical protein